jgi:hypothetical protein
MTKSRQFSKENLINTLKGLAIASTGAFALGFLDWLGQVELGDPTLSMVVSALVPTLINMLKEFLRTDK